MVILLPFPLHRREASLLYCGEDAVKPPGVRTFRFIRHESLADSEVGNEGFGWSLITISGFLRMFLLPSSLHKRLSSLLYCVEDAVKPPGVHTFRFIRHESLADSKVGNEGFG
jgi:hypothetical protein